MQLNLSDKVRIVTDPMNVIVQDKKITKNNDVLWINRTYHPTFKSALHSLVDRDLLRCDTLEDLVNKIEDLHFKIDRLKDYHPTP
jgi:hypothetical protein